MLFLRRARQQLLVATCQEKYIKRQNQLVVLPTMTRMVSTVALTIPAVRLETNPMNTDIDPSFSRSERLGNLKVPRQ